MIFYLKLRKNILLDSDLRLAEKELQNLFEEILPITKDTHSGAIIACPKECVCTHTRQNGIIGYIASNVRINIVKAAKLLSFIQEIWCKKHIELPETGFSIVKREYICYIPLLTMSEFLFYSPQINANTVQNILNTIVNENNKKSVIDRFVTSAPHIHSFHTYKAKFFPRFVHSLIVANYDIQKEQINICDPFLGSGTTLIEGALMGHNTCGIDIDPLSCFISRVKSVALHMKLCDINLLTENDRLQQGCKDVIKYEFPEMIRRKFFRWGNLDEMVNYESEISYELNRIEEEEEPNKSLHKIALSDALTKKFNIRMMGTGSGRFALEIAKTSLKRLIKTNISNEIKAIQTVELLKEIYDLDIPSSNVINGSATKRNFKDEIFDIIVTSPPYIPASSGREDYLTGKMISLKAMGYNEEYFNNCAEQSVGSMTNISMAEFDKLPKSVVELYKWLIKDDLRYIKAKPILSYYQAIKESLYEDKRTIKKDGKIIYIIGKETIFYSSSTKEILYRVPCDEIFIEIAQSVGLKVLETINIELDKKSRIARPRGSDKYYECAIIMSL